MRRGKKLLLLLLLLALAAGAYLFLSGREETAAEPEPTEDAELTLSSRAEAELTRLSWSYAGERNTLAQTDGVWSDPDDAALPVDQDIAVRMASAAARVKTTRRLGAVQSPADFGLAQPLLIVEASFTDGSSAEFRLGDTNGLSGERYLAYRGEVYTADDTLTEAFSYTRRELIKPETIPELTGVTAVELKTADKTLELIREEGSPRAYCSEIIWFCKSEEGLPAADTRAVNEYVASLCELPTDDITAYNASDAELESWGLGEGADTLTVRFLSDGGIGAFGLRFGAEEDGYRYFCIDGSRMVYRTLSDAIGTIVSAGYRDRFLPRSVCRIAIDELTALTVTLDGGEYAIAVSSAPAEDAEELRFLENGRELDPAAMRSALAAIYSLTAEATDGDPANAGAELLRVTYFRDAGAYGEMPLVFYEYDADSVLVSFNGHAYQLCRRSAVDTILDFFREAMTSTEHP